MKKNIEVRSERIRCSSVTRMLVTVAMCAIMVVAVGCQNGKCKSCLFGNRDKNVIDDTQLGQEKNQDPPTPPAETGTETKPLNANATLQSEQDQSIALSASPMTPEPEPVATLAANESLGGSQRIPNTAESADAASVASQQPSLGQIPDANSQARDFTFGGAPSTDSGVSQQYQSVAPSDSAASNSLGFAPSTLDHSSSLAPEVKDNELPPAPDATAPLVGAQPSATLPPEMIGQASPEAAEPAASNPGASTVAPPVESATPDPAAEQKPAENEPVVADYVPRMRDRYAIDSAYETKKPVTLKGTAQAQYYGNTAAATQQRSAARPAASAPAATAQSTRPARPAAPATSAASAPVERPADSSALIPNGQTSEIIPGMKLGVVDLSKSAKN